MDANAPRKSKPLRSPTFEAMRLLVFVCLEMLAAYQAVEATLSGRVIFPARYNRIVVTASENPGWFIAALVAWLLACAFLGYVCGSCTKRLLAALNREPDRRL